MSFDDDDALCGDQFDAAIQRARGGDRSAFEELYRSLSRRVHAFARVRGAADPEGMVNDVFLRVFTNLDRFEGSEAQFKAWVFTIARNKLIDESRRRQRRPTEVSEKFMPAEGVRAPDDVERDVMTRLGNDAIIAHLDRLTADQRDVVLLRIISGLTIDTIAEILGKQPGAIKGLQRRAFQSIARDLPTEAVPLTSQSTLQVVDGTH